MTFTSAVKPAPTGERPATHVFVASDPWSGERPRALVVCCSDGRWHAQVHEFIGRNVSDRPDLYSVPGGPAGLSVWSSSFDEAHVAEKSFRFLAEHHQLQAVWLIAHSECAYYHTKYHPHDAQFIVRRQFEDLKRSADTIRHWYPAIAVHQIFARRDDQRVLFETLDPAELRAD